MTKNKNPLKTLEIHNLKSAEYREVHVDGALGGLTPTGYINVSFYGQRAVIPKSTIFEMTEEGRLGDRIKDSKESKKGIIREFNNSYTREPMEVFIEKPLPRFVPAPNDLKNAMVKNSSIALSAALGKQK